jgi:dTDP-4-dehydrorhamnose reductase
MKIYIIGITGMLGSELFKRFNENKFFKVRGSTKKSKLLIFKKHKKRIDFEVSVNNLELLKKKILYFKPDCVINCVGIIKQKIFKKSKIDDILYINSIFPHKLYYITKLINSRLIHFSTDCVFDGIKGNYLENNEPNSDDIYGKTKFLGEINYQNTCTIRTSIIGHEYYNKLSLLEWFLSNKNQCNGFSNSFFSGLTTLEVYKFLVNYFFKKKYSGLLHLHSKKISKYNLLKIIKRIYNKKTQIKRKNKPRIDRSLNSIYLKNHFFYKAPTWIQMIKDMHQKNINH